MEIRNYKIFEEFQTCADETVLEEIREFLEADEDVESCRVESDAGNKIFVNMVLVKFTYLAARSVFLRLAEYMRRSYYKVYTCEEMGEHVCYRYLTGMPERDGIKMESVIG